MLKILIVDDNDNNRLLLRALLEDFIQKNNYTTVKISEAENGVDAVALAMDESYDLIFMDIMMPEMDGIEATRQIREHNNKVMIIAVSAVNEEARQQEILRNGAEDYISKPINTDIFRARLSSYFALISARNRLSHQHKASNLFSQEIYCKKVTFLISNDNDLAEFWESYLLNPHSEIGGEALSDTVRAFYFIGNTALKLQLSSIITVEESEESFYFTIDGIESIPSNILELVLKKNLFNTDYRQDSNSISIRIARNKNRVEIKYVDSISVAPTVSDFNVKIETNGETFVFDYMDSDDLSEMKEYIGKLDSLLLLVGSGDINSYEVESIAKNLERISKIASIYHDSYPIGMGLNALAEVIRAHLDIFIEKSGMLGPLCAAFSRDLTGWTRLIFEEGAPSVNYMDDTIVANAQMIGSILTMDDNVDNEMNLDDIFDF
ncbi:MAG: response regulator [Alphaproteobacteria bacterium]|nr:response regulator [Alphaproteobacteria bacterium]